MMGQGCGRASWWFGSRGLSTRSGVAASRWLLVSVLLGVLIGCAGDKDQASRRVKALEDKLMRLQNETDQLREQVVRLELQRRDGRAASAAQPADTKDGPTLERPRLKLIRLQPGAESSSPAGEASAPQLDRSDSASDSTSASTAEPAPTDLRVAQSASDDVEGESEAAARPVIKVRGGDVLSAADSETSETP